ncbi:MAG: phosphomannomutase [Succiniclasticum sp.]|uniref:phosphomannomutase n=1 Tax=Succiniclasticum sp. TaxID=2775030 RepID=UPI002A90D2B9|nr:phosphomannomutase [Succiniclasticum sp.]MDY6291637.1 phosphomannomutase [Succiniclasticum sp.]
MLNTKAFKAYDIRGLCPEEVNEELAYRVGKVFCALFGAESVVVGRDIRLTGPKLQSALCDGLQDGGANVIDIGQCGTEMIYFATSYLNADGGIMITASHNPASYNGLKLVRRDARPVGMDTGLKEIEEMVRKDDFPHHLMAGKARGILTGQDILRPYTEHILKYIDLKQLKPVKIVVNPGNGGAGTVVDELEKHLPFQFIKINYEPDGTFPNGVPNPMLEENRKATSDAVVKNQADFGIAWDGDFDRCFFCDETGKFVEGYYLVGLLAENFLHKYPGCKIMYDPRLVWNTEAIVRSHGGIPVRCKSGHAFMKQCMRENDVIYGGEMSSHHYFRDFTFCDSGMITALIVCEMLCSCGKKLSELIGSMEDAFPCSGEINRKVADSKAVLAKLEKKYKEGKADRLDGLSMEFPNWRFNLRASNTEPVIRLNVETRGDRKLLAEKTQELLQEIGGEPA